MTLIGGYKDKDWKTLETVLNRLEQDNLISHKIIPNYGYTTWKLTQLGYKKLMNYEVE